MEKIQTKFGFNVTQFGNLTIYSGKLRFKDIVYTHPCKSIKVEYTKKGYCIISYETIHLETHRIFVQDLGVLAKEIAQFKLNNKYSWVENN